MQTGERCESVSNCSLKTLRETRKNNVRNRGKQNARTRPPRPQIRTLFGGRIVPDPVAVDIINVLVSTVTSVLDIRLPNKWVRFRKGGSTEVITPMWHPHAAPWGMQSERFNQRLLRERGARRGNRRVVVVVVVVVVMTVVVVEGGQNSWGESRDYSDNQRALNLGPKRAETPSLLCRRVVLRR